MAKNTNLSNAKKAKNDEFYTRLADIEKELNEYDPTVFKDKTIFCNCDDATSSNFWVFFHMNFNRLGLKKLITTHYNMDGSSSYAMTYDSKDPKDDIDFDKGTKIQLKGNGDFRSDECIDLLKQSDMVVTNPPFSLFREYIAQLDQYNKQFIVIGNKNAITYKEIFPLIKDNKLWLGFSQPKEFDTPNGMTKKVNGLTRWFTNVDTKKRHHKLETVYRWRKRKEKYPDLYPKYDNYAAIEVGKVLQIPLDYDGIMGVPITFLDKYNPDQFEILGLSGKVGYGLCSNKFYDDYKEAKHDGSYTGASGKKTNGNPVLQGMPKKSHYFINKSGRTVYSLYARIFIKNKHPEDYQNDL